MKAVQKIHRKEDRCASVGLLYCEKVNKTWEPNLRSCYGRRWPGMSRERGWPTT